MSREKKPSSESPDIIRRRGYFNSGKIREQLRLLNDHITGRNLSLKKFTGLLSPKGAFYYKEEPTRVFINELVRYIDHYSTLRISMLNGHFQFEDFFDGEKNVDSEGIKRRERFQNAFLNEEGVLDDYPVPETFRGNMTESERRFFSSLFYCIIRIALYEEDHAKKRLEKKKATFNSIIEGVKSLEPVYRIGSYAAYEGRGDLGENLINFIYYSTHNADNHEILYPETLELRSIFDKINVYYWHLSGGRLPVDADISSYEKNDPGHYEALKSRQKSVEAERNVAKEKALIPDESDEDIGTEYNDFSDGPSLYIEVPPAIDSPEDFENREEFMKECEIFRFYLNAESYGYYRYIEKAEYAVDKYITEKDLCEFRDTDRSIYLYTMLSQAVDIYTQKTQEIRR